MIERTELIYEELTFEIRKCIFAVYNALGPGLREETYKRALVLEFELNGIPCVCEKNFAVIYRDKTIDEYRVDLIAYDKIVIEVKAVGEIHSRFEAQVLSYLKVSRHKLGLLVNFGTDKIFIKRYVNPHIG